MEQLPTAYIKSQIGKIMRTIGEVLIAVKNAENDEAKIEIIQKNKNLGKFRECIEMLTDPERDFYTLPEGVQYSTRDHVIGRTPTLMANYTTLRYLELPTKVRPDRLVSFYLGLMDVLHISEAELVACIVDRTELPYISNKLLREAFELEAKASTPPVTDPIDEVTKVETKVETSDEDVMAEEFNVVVDDNVTEELNDETVVPKVALKSKPKPKTKPKSKAKPRQTRKKK